MTEEILNTEVKAWHQKWWGLVFLIILAVFLVYIAAFLYQVVFYIEQKNALAKQLQQQINSNYALNNATVAQKPVIETADDPFIGPEKALITIVEFADFQCPYCLESYQTIKQINATYPNDVKIIFRDFPNVANHPDSLNAAMAANCAFDQGKFWEYHDLLYQNQSDLSVSNLKMLALDLGLNRNIFDQCFDSQKYANEAKNDLMEGANLGITGTPTFFVNGYEVKGSLPFENFKSIIDEYLRLKK